MKNIAADFMKIFWINGKKSGTNPMSIQLIVNMLLLSKEIHKIISRNIPNIV